MSAPAKNKSIIILDTFYDYLAANLARHKLQDHGIESFLEESGSFSINSFGSIELKIFSKDLKNAFKILSE